MENGRKSHFQYAPGYNGPPVSLTMPVREESYSFDEFSTFFDGLLPDGIQLEVLLRQKQLVYSTEAYLNKPLLLFYRFL
ncbi:MAG: HipA N-terminal domain-containing protein [Proteobacteria bacterium]|nr:HipA N-terminal domain-containing protein [Pseudomonadota bacterium]